MLFKITEIGLQSLYDFIYDINMDFDTAFSTKKILRYKPIGTNFETLKKSSNLFMKVVLEPNGTDWNITKNRYSDECYWIKQAA